MNRWLTIIRSLALGLLPVTGMTGCGYSTARPFPDQVQTVHVKILQSREFRRDLEFMLTEAIQKRINLDTPYRIAPLNKADSVFTGEILEVRNRTLGDDFETRLPRETGSTVIMAFRWKDLRNGRTLVERERFTYTTTYIPPVGETFTKGMVRGLDGMAESVVEAMESPW
ncbi:MAG: LPS assembly lipoprotein LptE [Phycisphaerae bacterium]